MKDAAETLLKTLIQFLKNTLGDKWPIAAALLAAAALFALTAYWSVPATARLAQRIKRHIGRHLLPRTLLKELDATLANEAVLNTYAPAKRFIRQLGEEEKAPKISAWISPYSRAVKAAITYENNKSLSQFHDARKQVRTAARQINIRPMNENEQVEFVTDDQHPLNQFILELKYDGKKPSQITALTENIKSQLELEDIQPIPAALGKKGEKKKKRNAVTLLCSKELKIEDRLTTIKHGKDWLDAHPAKSVKSIPIAFTVRDEAFALPTHHTLVFGSTGSGKSGPFVNTIYQLTPFAEKGIVRFYGIDPKYADLKVFEGSDLFPKIAHKVEDSIELINFVNELLNDRSANTKADLKNGKTGRTNEASIETPWIYFFVDEIVVLKNQLDSSGAAGRAAWKNFENIMMMGRARGIFLFVATQDATREVLEKLRPNFGNVIVLAQESEYLNGLFLGKLAAENGYDSTAIEQATPENDYKTSGIAFVKGDTGQPMKIRLAYIPDEDLAAFALEHGADPNGEGSLPEDELEALTTGIHTNKPSGIDLTKNDDGTDDLAALELDDLDALPDWAITPNDDDFDLPPLD